MKRLVLAIGLLASIQLTAQTTKLKASVPFDFRMGEVFMPAGAYDVTQSGFLVTVRATEGKAISASYLTLPTSGPLTRGKGSLVFNRYDDEYFLTKVIAPDSTDARAVPKGKQEKELIARAHGVQTASAALQRK